ncbi:MAG: efflux RND transporter periplasmic adaptor subunit [Bacteroidales bacterium]|nr:efflux RND transporter periplasmic adaptor subunit [Bacteroidales bacterium]
MKKGNKKWYFIIGGVLVALVIILVVAKKRNQHVTEVSAEASMNRTIVETVAANGKIQPALDVKISPYISGEVVSLFVREGAFVNKGDILAKIDPTIYLSNLEQVEANVNSTRANMANAKARVAQAEAQHTKAKLDFDRNEKLYKQQVISDADWDGVRSSFKVSAAELEAAQESFKATQFQVQNSEAALKEARENLKRTSIYAPNDGTVSKLSVEEGERVTGASQFSAGTEIMRIANLDRMEVKVEVSENDIPRVKLNDTCLIEVDAYLNRKFKGFVTEIATSANTTGVSADQVTNFEVKIMMIKDSYSDLINESKSISSPFRPGMSATVEIQTKQLVNVLSVPIQAVTTRSDTTEGRRFGKKKTETTDSTETETKVNSTESKQKEVTKEYVFVLENDKVRLQEVKTGIQDNTYIQILEGVEAGAMVVTGPYKAVSKSLKNGDQVKKVEKNMLFESNKK